jgi:hypothetical protein
MEFLIGTVVGFVLAMALVLYSRRGRRPADGDGRRLATLQKRIFCMVVRSGTFWRSPTLCRCGPIPTFAGHRNFAPCENRRALFDMAEPLRWQGAFERNMRRPQVHED